MSHASVLSFGERVITSGMVKGKRVLEVGSYDINGSLRPYVESLGPKEYVGTDIELGPKVDQVVPASELTKTFGPSSFDLVLCNEMLEHAEDWRAAVTQLKSVTKDYLLVTTRSEPFPYHGFPADNWRYTTDHFRKIFADMEVLELEDDPEYPGVFMLARKTDRSPIKLSGIDVIPAPPKPHWH